jgi:molybdopterin-guanine dinucleotide biosynthesis protein A
LDVDWVREEPPFAGPAAAVVAVLASWDRRGIAPEWTFLLACDLSHPDAAVAALGEAVVPRSTDGVCLVDDDGRPQWLAGRYRIDALRRAAAALPDAARDAPMRALLGGLTLEHLSAAADTVRDIDTWQDLDEARSRAGRHETS